MQTQTSNTLHNVIMEAGGKDRPPMLAPGTTVVQKSGIQCYNYKEFRHVARECQKPKRAKDAAYHREKMLLSHYMYMAQIQEVSPDAVNSGPIFDAETLQKNDDDYDLANERELLASLIEKLKETNALMYTDLKKFQEELDKRNDVKYASKVEIDCAKAK
nr:hypothetical protein [Tanacetum cinerariifolium]